MENQIRPESPVNSLVLGVVGCGVMGRGIAQIAALAGAQVRLCDSRDGASAAALEELRAIFAKLIEKGRLDPVQGAAAGARLQACDALQQLANCGLVVEAIVENLAAKKDLFNKLEEIVATDAILASNTSSLSVTAIAAGMRHPERVAGFHFFNPVPLMKIVEVIGGLLTAPEITDTLLEIGRHWGHTAVRAKDTPGFIVNHAGRGYGTEGLRVLAEAVCSVGTLDAILRDTAGFRIGPCELMDLVGLDVSHPVMESIYHQYYQEPRFRPQGQTRQMLAGGLLGRKTGRGFYRYDAGGKKQEVALAAPAALKAERVWLSRARPQLAERIAALIAGCGSLIETGAIPSAAALCIVTPLGDDATACCVREGLDGRRTVGVESLLDLSRRRVVMTTPMTAPDYCAMACGVLGADGTAVSVIRDSSGLVTQRVVAHIVNIACEIAQQGIADPLDIDHAVMLGLGYPLGPLAWGDRIGAATVLAILNQLVLQTGDARYRPSHWLQRRAALGLSLHHKELNAYNH